MTSTQTMTMEEFKAMERLENIHELVREAHAEDAREGSHFDRAGWANFFPEDLERDPEAVEEAWTIYENEVHGVPEED